MKIVCFGDSNTYGYDARMLVDNRYPAEYRWVDILAHKTGWTMVNKGLNGREIPPHGISVPDDTDLLIVMLGTNDLLQGHSVDTVTARMEHFLGETDFPAQKTLLLGPVPMQNGVWVPDSAIAERSSALCERYRELARKRGVDFANAGEWNVGLTFDGIHYTEEGQIAFANGLYQHLNTK